MKQPKYVWEQVPQKSIPNVVLSEATNGTGKLAQYIERAGKGATQVYFVNSASNRTEMEGLSKYPDANEAIETALPLVSKGARVRVDEQYMTFAQAAKLDLQAYASTSTEGRATNYWKQTRWMTDETAEMLNESIYEKLNSEPTPTPTPKPKAKAKGKAKRKSPRGF
tara:strand:+ start:479 stop:979 length:501 start_codon:yes stop_codon:yes gene_type:complete